MISIIQTIAQLITLDISNLLQWLYPALTAMVDYFVLVGGRFTGAINSGIDGFFN
jgi:hypothetical protein